MRPVFELTYLIERARGVPCMGAALAFLAGIFFATASFTVNLIPSVNPLEIVITRSIGQLIVYGPFQYAAGDTTLGAKGERLMLLARSVTGYLSFAMFYMALRCISLSDASTIVFSAPVYVSLFACVLIGESCGVFKIVTVFLTMAGVVLISKPSFVFGGQVEASEESKVVGVILSFLSSLTMALTFIIMRKLQKTSTSVIITHFSWVCIALAIPTLYLLDKSAVLPVTIPTTFHEYLCIVLNSLFGVVGQFLLTVALKIEQAGLVSLLRTIDIVAAFFFQVAFLDQEVAWTSLLGAVIVVTGVVLSCLKKLYEEKPEMFWRQRTKELPTAEDVSRVDCDTSISDSERKSVITI